MARKGNAKGFTLVELMVVVAILGLLAAIAIPQYQNFMLRTRRSEAVILLGAVHKSQMSYYSMHEQYYPPPGGNGSPASVNAFFGLGPVVTRLGWIWTNTFVADAAPPGPTPRSARYFVILWQHFDTDIVFDQMVIQSPQKVWPNCPDSVPFLDNDDIRNISNICS